MNTFKGFWKQSYSSTASKKHPKINDFHSFSHPFVSKAIQAQVQNSVQKTTISVVFRIRFWAKLYKHMITPASKNQWFSSFFESVSKQMYTSTDSKQRPKTYDFCRFSHPFLTKAIQAQVQNSVQKPTTFVVLRTRFWAKLYKHRIKPASKNRWFSLFFWTCFWAKVYKHRFKTTSKSRWFSSLFAPVSQQSYTSTGSKQISETDLVSSCRIAGPRWVCSILSTVFHATPSSNGSFVVDFGCHWRDLLACCLLLLLPNDDFHWFW